MQTPAVEAKLTLEEFLNLPETKLASEFMNGEIIQKPMPQGEHSVLRGRFCSVFNQVAEPSKIALAFPELRCTFGGASIVPDVAVFRWARIPFQPSGRVANRFNLAPDWSIEILSPEQSSSKVLRRLLHCSQQGTELGWLISPEEETVLTVYPGQRVELFEGAAQLPVLEGLALELSVDMILSWLVFQ